MSQQSKRQAEFRTLAGVASGTYNENLIQAARVALGNPPGTQTANEYQLLHAKQENGGTAGTNLPANLHAWSQTRPGPPTNWSSSGDIIGP